MGLNQHIAYISLINQRSHLHPVKIMIGMQPINHITVTYTMKSRFSAQPIPLLLHITTYHPTKIAVNKCQLVSWCKG